MCRLREYDKQSEHIIYTTRKRQKGFILTLESLQSPDKTGKDIGFTDAYGPNVLHVQYTVD